MMGDTTDSTSVFISVLANDKSTTESDSVLAAEEDEDAKEAEVEGVGDANGGVDAL